MMNNKKYEIFWILPAILILISCGTQVGNPDDDDEKKAANKSDTPSQSNVPVANDNAPTSNSPAPSSATCYFSQSTSTNSGTTVSYAISGKEYKSVTTTTPSGTVLSGTSLSFTENGLYEIVVERLIGANCSYQFTIDTAEQKNDLLITITVL